MKNLNWLIILFSLTINFNSYAQINFNSSGLQGEISENPTSLQFGPDNRLYVAQQNGLIYAYTISRNGPNNYTITATETIDIIINNTPNHDDDGNYNDTKERQITGIFLTGTMSNPVLYVSSSDWRIGAGGGGNDLNLDTNSGILHRLTWNGSAWEKIDLVRGFPRSEENHSVNGMVIDPFDPDILYLTVGGHTNAGSPSNNFAFHTEYAYSAAILKIDLSAINSMPVNTTNQFGYTYKWIYDLPTLDDPTRTNISSTDGYTDSGDPFGGNDGLNQAKIDPSSPVQIYSPGWRNVYDLLITVTPGREGRMYAVDNGANGGWGGHPDGEADYPAEALTASVTNKYLTGEPGSTSNGPGGDPAVNNKNGLHYIRPLVNGDLNYVPGDPFNNQIYYAGHPTPVRGNPDGAGLFTKGTHTLNPNDGSDSYWRNEILNENDPNFSQQSLPIDWPPVPLSMANPAEGDFRNSGETDGALVNYGPSTNGICEYTASNFNNELKGDLLMAGFKNDGPIFRATLSADGKSVLNCPDPPNNCNKNIASGFGSTPLDVIAQGDNDIFPGTIWAVTYGSDNIVVFEPGDYDGGGNPCNPVDAWDVDSDNDGYPDADEFDNGTDPCSGSSQPEDFDKAFVNGFLISNLNDDDDDEDGIIDVYDAFQWDATNGFSTDIPFNNDLFNVLGYGFGDIGMTGLMTNGTTDYLNQFDADETIFGGTAGLFTLFTTFGDVTQNNQDNAFQFGINVGETTGTYVIKTKINAPFFNNETPQNYQSQGFYISTGDQDNYFKLVLAANSGSGGFEVYYEGGGIQQSGQLYNVANLLSETEIELFLEVDPVSGTVQPKYSIDNINIINLGSEITISGSLLNAIKGNYSINGIPSALAVGIISTSYQSNPSFACTWDYFSISLKDTGNNEIIVEDISNQTNTEGEQVDLAVVASGGSGNFTYEALGLPPGLSIEPTNGHIFGTIQSNASSNSPFQVTITVTDNELTNTSATTNFEWEVIPIMGTWESITNTNEHIARHENAFVRAGNKFYILGGRESDLVEEYDYATKTWSAGAESPISINHFQAVEYEGLIWAICGFKDNNFPTELPADYIYLYDPVGDFWLQGPEIPAARRRGSAGVVLYNNKFYIIGGITNGHTNGWVSWVDEYDPATNSWRQLPDAPRARDHFQAVEINDKIYVSSGRRSGEINTLSPTIGEVDVFDLSSEVWLSSALPDNIPTERAGAAVVYYNNKVVVIGGESTSGVFANTEALDINTGNWDTWDELNTARHGTQAIVSGSGIFITSGSPNKGGGNMTNMEVFGNNNPQGIPITASSLNTIDQYSFSGAPGNVIINLINADGNQGIFIESISLTGTDMDKFSLPSSGLEDILLSAGQTYGLFLEYTGNDPQDNAEILIEYGFNQQKTIQLSGGASGPVNYAPLVTNPGNQTAVEGDNVSLQIVASDGDSGTQTLSYAATGLPPGLSINTGSGLISGQVSAGTSSGSPYAVTVTVTDDGTPSNSGSTVNFTWTVNTSGGSGGEEGLVLHRLNVGGSKLDSEDPPKPDWDKDSKSKPSSYRVSSSGIDRLSSTSSNAHPGAINMSDASLSGLSVPIGLFEKQRNGSSDGAPMEWEFPVSGGTQVKVKIYLIELFNGVTGPGQRVFDIALEGVVPSAMDDIDMFARAGAKKAFMIESVVTVSGDGILDIDFINTGLENPVVSGFEIVEFTGSGGPVNNVPLVTNPGNQTAVEGDNVSLQIVASDGDSGTQTLSYAATGLPPGLSINTGSGLISGQVSAGASSGSPYAVTVTVTDDGTPSNSGSTINFNWTVNTEGGPVNNVPLVTNPGNQTAVEGDNVSLQIVASDGDSGTQTLSYAATGLPPGLSINTGSGLISGQVSAGASSGSPYAVTVTVTDDGTPSNSGSTVNFTWTVNTSGGSGGEEGLVLHRLNVGGSKLDSEDPPKPDWDKDSKSKPSSYRVSSSGIDRLSSTSSNAHPGAINMSDASLSGLSVPIGLFEKQRNGSSDGAPMEWEFPVSGGTQVKVKIFLIELFNGVTGPGQRVFDIALEGVVPSAMDDIDMFARAGAKKAFMIESVVTVSGDGILDIDFINTGLENPVVSGFEIVEFTGSGGPVNNVPLVTNPGNQTAVEGDNVSLQIVASDGDSGTQNLSYAATGLPPGLSINTGSGLISGQVSAGASSGSPYAVTVTVTDDGTPSNSGSTINFTWTVNTEGGPVNNVPLVTNPGNQTAVEGDNVSLQIVASDGDSGTQTLSYAATGLPPGLSINTGSGLISGQVSTGASSGSPYAVTVTVTDDGTPSNSGSTVNFTWTVNTSGGSGGEEELVLHRLNVGGSKLDSEDPPKPDWDKDSKSKPSSYRVSSSGIDRLSSTSSNAHPGAINMSDASLSGLSVPIGLFEKQRNGSSDGAPMEWEFPVSGGTQVKVKIFLIELFNGVTGPGQRVFDIALEGVVPSAMDDIDMFARAGAKKAFMIESVVTVSGDGILDIDFINTGLENPVVSGFEIVEFNEASSRKASQTLVVKEPQNTDYQFDVYPNPTSGILNFDLENNNELPYKLEVFNTLGIKIHELMGNGSGKEQIDLFKLGASHGMYLIVLKVGNSDRELHKIILR